MNRIQASQIFLPGLHGGGAGSRLIGGGGGGGGGSFTSAGHGGGAGGGNGGNGGGQATFGASLTNATVGSSGYIIITVAPQPETLVR